MPIPSRRSRSVTRKAVRTPSGKISMHFTKRQPSRAQCGRCGAVLQGVPRVRAMVLKRLPKSKKRPQRPYGGNLCSSCMRQLFVEKARGTQ